MNIQENITLSLTAKDVEEIVKDWAEKRGYVVRTIIFDVEEQAEGWPPYERYDAVFAGAKMDVTREDIT